MKAQVIIELQRIAKAHQGILKPKHVVESARNPSSPLHGQFEWNNSKAAHAYRLWQARQLISVCVTLIPNGSDEPERIWVSLRRDREQSGYRALVDVLSDKELRDELLQEAMNDMEYFEEKYQRLNELADVFKSMKKVRLQQK